MKLLKQAHTVYRTQYHLVWVTRYRRKILTPGIATYLKLRLKEIRKFLPDIIISEIGTDHDHVHMHIIIPPKYAVSKIVEAIKSNTSRELKKKFPDFLTKVYWDTGGIWATGFFVSTVGLDEATIKRYVQMQGKHDAGQVACNL
jgi:putative transposase